jgi:hypothetical protein
MFEFVRNLISGMSERERRMVLGLVFAFVVFILFIVWFLVRGSVTDLREKTETYEEGLSLIAQKQGAYLEQKAQNLKGKSARKPTPLRTLVDKIGRQLGVNMPDVKELPEQRHSPLWLEHSVELSMRGIGLVNLTKFMEEIESNRQRFPIAITKLEVRKQKRVQDVYNVKMVITTYEQNLEEKPKKRSKTKARATKGGR